MIDLGNKYIHAEQRPVNINERPAYWIMNTHFKNAKLALIMWNGLEKEGQYIIYPEHDAGFDVDMLKDIVRFMETQT